MNCLDYILYQKWFSNRSMIYIQHMNKLFWLVKWKILHDLIIKIIIAFVFTRHSYPVMCLAFSMLHRYTMHSANEAEATGCRQNVKKGDIIFEF